MTGRWRGMTCTKVPQTWSRLLWLGLSASGTPAQLSELPCAAILWILLSWLFLVFAINWLHFVFYSMIIPNYNPWYISEYNYRVSIVMRFHPQVVQLRGAFWRAETPAVCFRDACVSSHWMTNLLTWSKCSKDSWETTASCRSICVASLTG